MYAGFGVHFSHALGICFFSRDQPGSGKIIADGAGNVKIGVGSGGSELPNKLLILDGLLSAKLNDIKLAVSVSANNENLNLLPKLLYCIITSATTLTSGPLKKLLIPSFIVSNISVNGVAGLIGNDIPNPSIPKLIVFILNCSGNVDGIFIT